MNIVFVATEMVPFVKTGGLGDVCGALPRALARQGHSVAVFLPKFKQINEGCYSFVKQIDSLKIPIGAESLSGSLYGVDFEKNLRVYFVENIFFFERDGLYGEAGNDYHDNHKRFIFFQRYVLESLRVLNYSVDIIHCHDWQSALIPVYLKSLYKHDLFFEKTKSFFTIHNLAYQGNFSADSFYLTGLSWKEFACNGLEFYGKASFMKGGILFSDCITTVSETYASEIQTSEYGCALDGVLLERSDSLYGILNGLDVSAWNPETDCAIAYNYGIEKFSLKFKNKEVLQKRLGLQKKNNAPLLGMVGRMVNQKGFDILVPIVSDIIKGGGQFVFLGVGDENLQYILKDLSEEYPESISVNFEFDDNLARNIYAASDMFLMPSFFEPCGIGQMIAMRYGSIPIVRRTGGLADTVVDSNSGIGNGFVFTEYDSASLLKAIMRAFSVFENKRRWYKLMKNAFSCDFSWETQAKEYIECYKSVILE